MTPLEAYFEQFAGDVPDTRELVSTDAAQHHHMVSAFTYPQFLARFFPDHVPDDPPLFDFRTDGDTP